MLEDVDIQALKTGMLRSAGAVRAVARTLKEFHSSATDEGSASAKVLPPLVCDPVCVSTSGHTLLEEDAIDVLIDEIFPLAAVVTPNTSEASLILARRHRPCEVQSLKQMLQAADELCALGCRAVLLKGGHLVATNADVTELCAMRQDIAIVRDGGLPGENMEILLPAEHDHSTVPLVVDVLCQRALSPTLFIRPRIDSTSTHGTGCTLSAALACSLARGLEGKANLL